VNVVLAQVEPAATTNAAEFWVFVVVGAVALGSAIAMVLMRNAVHSALMLVVNLFTVAALYAVLEAQFLAVIQLIVYAGAIMVLFLFVIMLLGVSRGEALTGRIRGQKPVAVLLGVLLFAGLAASTAAPFLGEESVCGAPAEVQAEAEGIACQGLAEVNVDGNVRAIGERLFTDFVWPFEVMSVLLVIAAIGAIVLGKRRENPEELVDPIPEAEPEEPGEPEAAVAEVEEGER
jgi:NADH-quinone oxidoreductase subunit J